jgi:hypothetical protein
MIRTSLQDVWGQEDQRIRPKTSPSQQQHVTERQINLNHENFQQIIGANDDERKEARLLNNINQMLADSENFIISKSVDLQRDLHNQTQKAIDRLTEAKSTKTDNSNATARWIPIVILVLLIVFFIVLFVTQHCYFAKTIRTLKALNLARVPLDVYHPNLIQI